MRHAPGNVPRLVDDAAALVRVASPNDWPGGFVVVADRLPPRIAALACGDGRGLAELYGCREGAACVVVDVWKRAANPEAPTLAEVASLEALSCHEAAHTLTTGTATAEAVDKLLSTADRDVAAYSPETVARQHGPRWAMAFWLLVNRAAAYRPRSGAVMVEGVAIELGHYGYPRHELVRLAGGVSADEPLRERLAVGGDWDALLSARLPDESTRAAAIVAAGISKV